MDALFHNRVPPFEELINASKEELLKVHPCGCTHLRHSVEGVTTLQTLELLIDRAPEAFLIPNKKGNTVLSCVRYFTAPVIGCIVAKRAPQEAFLQLDSDRDTPLHCVIQNRAQNVVIQAYVKRSPRDVFVTANNDGKLPVHEAVRYGINADTVQLLLEYSPANVLNTADKGGDLPIHLLPRNSSQELAQVIVDKSPTSALSQANSHGRWPLHCAVAAGVSMEVFLAVLSKTPAHALSIKDKYGQLPLHMIGWQLSNDIVRELVDRSSKDALMTQDSFGRLPIHYAIIDKASFEIMQQLVDSGGPDTLLHLDIEGHIPLYHAFNLQNEQERNPADTLVGWQLLVTTFLVQRAPPGMLATRGSRGQIPLHDAIDLGVSRALLQVLLLGYPDAVKVPDNSGRLPLHYAVARRRLPFESFQVILDAFPGAVCRKDSSGKTPLLVACDEDASLDVVFSLLRLNPQFLILSSNNENENEA